jgi:hypothetical protein
MLCNLQYDMSPIRHGQVPALIQLVEFIKGRTVGWLFEHGRSSSRMRHLVQERDKESRSPDPEVIVQYIKKPASKIHGFTY